MDAPSSPESGPGTGDLAARAAEPPQGIPTGRPTGFGPSGRAGRPPVQRLRVTFAKEQTIRFIGHLDVVRLWERALRRARVPLAYTLGFAPHARLAFAAPLALGATGEAELLEVYLAERLDEDEFVARAGAELPPGCRLVAVEEMALESPSLMAQVRWVLLRVTAGVRQEEPRPDEGALAGGSRWSRGASPVQGLPSDANVAGARESPTTLTTTNIALSRCIDNDQLVPWRPPLQRLPPPVPAPPLPAREEIDRRISALLAAETLPRQRTREGKLVRYDLRPLLLDLAQDSGAADQATVTLEMVLRADPSGAGRPEEVAAALGLVARQTHRVKIGLEGQSPPHLP